MNAEQAARLLLMYAVVPLWIVAGLVDWWCHRRTAIERTSGLPENLFHWLLFAQAGAALAAVGLLEVNAAVLLLVFAAFLAHEATTFVELRYTVPRREVRPFEQMVHSFMELLPLLVLALLAVMAWDQALALFAAGEPDLALHAKAQPWPPAYLLSVAGAVLVLNVLPLAEEGVRCLRARR
ncbi:MAG TPA: diguanylate cyclase [Ramlibacter sp.]